MEPNTPQTPNQSRIKIYALVGGAAFVALCIAGVVWALGHGPQKAGATPTPTPHVIPTSTPNSDVIAPDELKTVIKAYAQAHENAVGANQATPVSWIDSVKSIVTPSMLASLQPPAGADINSGSDEFRTAHANGYTVKVALGQCNWDYEQGSPTPTEGIIGCDVTDTTINQNTGKEVVAADLPFAWTHTGLQTTYILKVTKQSGKWLIDADQTGNLE